MSIRKKLLLSHIAMIIIPVVVFVLTAMLLVSSLMRSMTGTNPGQDQHLFPAEAFARNNEMFAGLAFMADYRPDTIADAAFLQQTERRLQELNAGIAVIRSGKLVYASSLLGERGPIEAFLSSDVEPGEQRFQGKLELNGKQFTVQKHKFTFENQTPGVIYFFGDVGPTMRFFRLFFPLLFVTLLLVIGLTNGLLTYVLSRSIVRPLKTLKEAAEHIREGDLEHKLAPGRKDEIGELSDAFEEMRHRLRESIHTQLQYETNRKELLANITHDLKTPITAIGACVDGLRDGIADTPEKRMKYLQSIHKKVSDLNHLIDELFLFSKLDLKKLSFHYEPMDIAAYLHDTVAELRLDPQNHSARFSYRSDARGPVIVMADRDKITRVVTNIVNNSIHYADKQPIEIRVELTERDDDVIVQVSDNGRGIETEALPQIFDRFYRADPSRSRNTGGSGLGLAIVKQIVEEHGGTTWAESRAGEGTDIFFTLTKSGKRQVGTGDENIDH
ncbi:ATP-binding protein [Paenibacillus allorhizosphaerae]|uniref:histidine kinase n=1 Tax=Paenibacillus allorhizosphaerae TaxID=2849866 RepID=A0ABN7TIB7_9BACL|nr:HAMP domain-containing sensor histidine kinase [Paenibacillus allorhizosphaerae]CAG7631928.1 Adaptive-response sensory-kinase SasA [Paenibacillus allorhizosphaerae]